mgnify:CR=1 FL=1
MEKYKVIDWRLRPPYGSFKNNKIFNDEKHLKNPAYPPSARQFSMDLLIQEMDAAGVEIGVVPFRAGQDHNDIEKLMTAYPGRFECMAHIDPYAEDPVADIDKWIVHGKAKLAIIEPGQYFIKKAIPADDSLLFPIYEKCQAENIVLTIVHGGLYSDSLELYNPIYIDRVAKRYPDLKIVITHGGWPYTTEICHVAYMRPNVYISPDCYLSKTQPGWESYVTAANNSLKDKIIFGSVYPGRSMQRVINDYIEAGISEEALPKVFYHNAAQLLGLE